MLPRYYAVSDVAAVGGTFAPYGGHNPLEPAACGAAVVIGPYHASQLEGVRALVAAGGARVAREEGSLAAARSQFEQFRGSGWSIRAAPPCGTSKNVTATTVFVPPSLTPFWMFLGHS